MKTIITSFLKLPRRTKRQNVRFATTSSTGALLPEPQKIPFGILGVICTVVPGLLIGATISKYMANFLEENELFVPSDDDDDDD
ncbi:essential MCU regulator, mitochondrial-like [Daktulosphaira vitifoliae]|uniref:essential MCU regulator, mitochondrial-like n=1 Tax=Daktulosphaira vitifoliae TaxID=58002 RepID=UPI0021A9AB59|nr:essential MCU regulator, mitochondrial-like [Daktulosphaira vitifoliae]XP_050548268.1 essential MCU regulator, mitochondrial-like [Daktulosphaira vitifoliae]